MEAKNLEEKLNKRNKSKNARNEAEYIKYKEQVKTARIEAIWSLISDFDKWLTLSKKEKKYLNKIIEDLENYLIYLEEE